MKQIKKAISHFSLLKHHKPNFTSLEEKLLRLKEISEQELANSLNRDKFEFENMEHKDFKENHLNLAGLRYTIKKQPGSFRIELFRKVDDYSVNIFLQAKIDPENYESLYEEKIPDEYVEIEHYIPVTVVINKEGKSHSLVADLVMHDFVFGISSIFLVKDGDKVFSDSREIFKKGRYIGPAPRSMNQSLLNKFQYLLEKLGFTDSLGYYLSHYIYDVHSELGIQWTERCQKFLK